MGYNKQPESTGKPSYGVENANGISGISSYGLENTNRISDTSSYSVENANRISDTSSYGVENENGISGTSYYGLENVNRISGMSYYGWGWGKRNLELVRDTKKQDDFQGGTYRRDAAGTDGRCGESSIEVRSVPASKYAPQFNQEALYD